MLVWQTLVATPVSSPWRTLARMPSRVRFSTPSRPRRSSLIDSVPSTLMSGVALPAFRSRSAVASVMGWPLVKIWK